MIVFLDFEASSLGKHGFPIEVGWAAEDGTEEAYLIRPAAGWEEWSAEAEAIHRITLARLAREGTPHDVVARRMVEALTGHQLYASAPSWDGQWLSRLLRAAGLPRHALRLQDTEEAQRQAVLAILEHDGVPADRRDSIVAEILEAARDGSKAVRPAHRALEDARGELGILRDVINRAKSAGARARAR